MFWVKNQNKRKISRKKIETHDTAEILQKSRESSHNRI